jgi:hypothetical protein
LFGSGVNHDFRSALPARSAYTITLVNELEELDPVSQLIRSDRRGLPGNVPPALQKPKVLELVPRLDALLDLLADGGGNGIKTIQ